MPLFDRDLSDEFEYGREQTPNYDLLNRSPRKEVEVVRRLMEDWLGMVPEAEMPRLLASLKSRNNLEHGSAFFELYCQQLLLRNGYQVSFHAPGSKGRAKDFRAERSGAVFEMEAVICADSNLVRSKKGLQGIVLDHIDYHAFVPGFQYSVQVRNAAADLPPLRRLTEEILEWARSFNWQEVKEAEGTGYDSLPKHTFLAGEWVFQITLIPTTVERMKSTGFRKAIGIGPIQGGFLEYEKTLLNTLKRKASHYEEFEYPFVIALNAMFDFPLQDEIDILQALIGREQLTVDIHTMKTRASRAPDGLWVGPKGPRNKHVSAVLLVDQLRSWYVAKAPLHLYLNPWALKPIGIGTLNVRTSTWDLHSRLKNDTPGKEPWEIFGLDRD